MSEDAARRAGEVYARKRRRQSVDPAIGRARRSREFQHGGTSCGEPVSGGRRCALTLGHSGRHAAP